MLNLSKDEKKAITKSILDYAKKCGFDIYICGLEYSLVSDINQLNLQLNCYENSPSDYEIQLQKLLSSVQSLTAKEDLIMRLKQRLITMLAVKLNHPKVFLGPNATRLSSQLLSAVAQGRGAQIAQEIVSTCCFEYVHSSHLFNFFNVSFLRDLSMIGVM